MSVQKLDFQRITKDHTPYTVVLNSVIQSINNPEALAIWVFLYSLPTDWQINKEFLKKKFSLGDKKMRAIFSDLNRANLIQYVQERNDDGTLSALSIHVLSGEHFDKSQTFEAEETAQAKTASADVQPVGQKTTLAVNRTSGLEALQKKYINKRNKKEKKERGFCSQKPKSKRQSNQYLVFNETTPAKRNNKP